MTDDNEHSGHAIECPESCEHVPRVLWWGACVITMLVGLLMVVEGMRWVS